MAEVVSIAVGFVLTTIVGGWWAGRLQDRSWTRQNQLRVAEEDTRRASEVCDDLTRLLDKRVYRMLRLYWAVAECARGEDSATRLEARLLDYNELLYEWNDRLNANLALVGTHFGSGAREYLFFLYDDFARIGRELEVTVVGVRRGDDVSASLDAIHREFQGWSPDSLNGRVYNLGLAMTTQLRDGLVGGNAPDRQVRPTLGNEGMTRRLVPAPV